MDNGLYIYEGAGPALGPEIAFEKDYAKGHFFHISGRSKKIQINAKINSNIVINMLPFHTFG
jgi:hypothetical protein